MITIPLFLDPPSQLILAIAKNHDFCLDNPITVGEAERLMAFLELVHTRQKYKELESMDDGTFSGARAAAKRIVRKEIEDFEATREDRPKAMSNF